MSTQAVATGRFLPIHGESNYCTGQQTPEYRVLCGIIARCCNPNNKAFGNYGGRGIKVCDQWRNSYETFLCDVGRRPSSEYSLDRYPDKNGNYEPGNVRWATDIEQGRNKRNNLLVEINGETRCLAEWLERLGVSRPAYYGRIYHGLSPQEALLDGPSRGRGRNR